MGEQAQVQLAGVLVALEGGYKVSDVQEGDYGWSLAYEKAKRLRQIFDDALEGQTDEEWLAHAKRFKGGSAETWAMGNLIERFIAYKHGQT